MKAPADWVPREVRLEAERIALGESAHPLFSANSRSSNPRKEKMWGEVARLLITDRRMEKVWRALQGQSVLFRSPTPERFGGLTRTWDEMRQGSGIPASMTDIDAALIIFLRHCVYNGASEYVTETARELRQWATTCQKQSKRLRAEAKAIRDRYRVLDREIEKQARELENVATWNDQQAAHYRGMANNQRDKGWRRQMGLARKISKSAQLLYGEPCYGTTATVVNVITKRTPHRHTNDAVSGVVTKHHVRDWLKRALPRRRKP